MAAGVRYEQPDTDTADLRAKVFEDHEFRIHLANFVSAGRFILDPIPEMGNKHLARAGTFR
jgi:hypothetical protein